MISKNHLAKTIKIYRELSPLTRQEAIESGQFPIVILKNSYVWLKNSKEEQSFAFRKIFLVF